MPMRLEGSCHCGEVRFAVASHTPQPYQLCYCSICRKTAGGGGYAINSWARRLARGARPATRWRSSMPRSRRWTTTASAVWRPARRQRHFCRHCASALWLFDPRWPDLVHPFASAIDSELPVPPTASI